MIRLFLAIVWLATAGRIAVRGQVLIKIKDRPLRHALYSAVLPGAGQVANKKYWKVPIIYGLMGGTIYGWHYHRSKYRQFRQAYLWRTDDDPATIDPYDPAVPNGYPKYSETTLLEAMRYYRRYRDLMAMAAVGAYLLNIMDAYVDAHLKNFDLDWEGHPDGAVSLRMTYRLPIARRPFRR